MAKIMMPFIEKRLENPSNPNAKTRTTLSKRICQYLDSNLVTENSEPITRELFYAACESILCSQDSERILLYLPFNILKDAPETFKNTYLRTWYHLLNANDVRENFHFGDCYEKDAIPPSGLEHVVKCAHLTPWLLKYGFIDKSQILKILDENHNNNTLLQSFKDTWNYLGQSGIISDDDLSLLRVKTAHLPERVRPKPLYISEKRQKWLNEVNQPVELLTPTAKLEGPFSDNIPALRSELEGIASELRSLDVAFVGGSRLKGYGTMSSDLDVWKLSDLRMNEILQPGSPYAIHIYFNTIWIFGQDIEEKSEIIAKRIIRLYTDSIPYTSATNIKYCAIRRLESELLQYRLLHKGFARFTGRTEHIIPSEMEGDCPFYDEEYRKIATMLYAKYVWI